MRGLRVIATGPLTTVQDLGRPGLARWGVGVSGAADRGALCRAGRLVGNPGDAAGLEVTGGGLVVRAEGDGLLAVTGAPCAPLLDGRPVGLDTALRVPDGGVLALGPPVAGVRTYVAVRGGLAVPPVLGSRATDLLAGVGPPRPRPGDLLPVGPPPAGYPPVDQAPVPPPVAGEVRLRVLPGPRGDPRVLLGRPWTVSPDSDRVGVRLDGPPLAPDGDGELPSEGVVPGAVQVPPSGRPVVFLADHPLTGGYPVVAVVVRADVDRAAQLRPGQPLRFVLSR